MPLQPANIFAKNQGDRNRPFRVRGPILVLGFLAVLLLAPLLAILLFPDRLLEEVRPWLERVASDRLEARVRIGRMSIQPLASGRLRVEELRLEREEAFLLDVPHLEVDFTIGGLWARRLELVRLVEPAVTFFISAGGGGALPERPPVTIRRLQVTGGRAKVQKDGRSFRLREVEASGSLDTVSTFRIASRVGEGEGIVLAIAGTAVWGAPPAITLEEGAWDGRPLLAAPLALRFPEGAADGTLRLDRFDDTQLNTLLAAFELESPLPADWSFALLAPEIRFRFAGSDLQAHLRSPEATLVIGDITLPLQEVKGDIEGPTDWQGAGTFRLADAPVRLAAELAGDRLTGTFAVAAADPAALKRRLLGGDFPPLSGGAVVEGKFARHDGVVRLQAKARGLPGPATPGAVLDLSRLTAEGTVEVPSAGPLAGRGRLLLKGRELVRFDGTEAAVQATLLPATGRELLDLIPLLPPALPADSEGIAGTATLARGAAGRWEGEVRLQAARVPAAAGALRDIEFQAPVGFGPADFVAGPAALTARLQGEGTSARLAAAATASAGEGAWHLDLERLTLTDLEYLAADGLSGLTGGHLEASGTVAAAGSGTGVAVDLSAALGAREFLHGPLYADLAALPATLAVRGVIDANGALRAERLALDVPGIGRAELQGEMAPSAAALGGTLSIPDLAAAWGGPLGQAVAALNPRLKELRPAGAMEADLAGGWSDGRWRLAGEVRPQGVDLSWPAVQLSARGLRGRVPFDLRPGSGAGAEGVDRRGDLHFSALRLGPATMAEAAVTLVAAPNRLQAESPLIFSLAGGTVEVAEATAAFLPGGTEAAARVRLRDLDLVSLTRSAGWVEMRGQVSADLGRIRFAGDTLVAEGLMVIDAFGGRMRVGGLRLESIFSDYAAIEADAEFTGIDLHQLTRTFEFGEINGIADGYVRGLRLFGGTPSAFEAVLETREEGRRNISVKALNNLSVLSQGGFSSILSRGVYRFIDFYRYRKIGISCSLRNDVFTLHGTARPDSNRYLVHGGLLPPKIDVVAAAHTISFKEMLRRLQRIERTETSTAPAGN